MKSECSEYQKQIVRFFLGDLDADDRRGLEEHLAECANCRAERASYAGALELLKSAGDLPVPHHFFVHPEERTLTPWQLFCRMRPAWQVIGTAAMALALLVCLAAFSRLQIRSGSDGWTLSFGDRANLPELKEEILKAAEARNREILDARMLEVQTRIDASNALAMRQQRDLLAGELASLDSRFKGRIAQTEDHMRADTRELVFAAYQTVSHQRAQDLAIMNLRLDALSANSAIKSRQTSEILGTLLEVAELKLNQNGDQK
jgi:hypothetical protein